MLSRFTRGVYRLPLLSVFRGNQEVVSEKRGSFFSTLSRQLHEATSDMEGEVAKVCRGFNEMASRARNTVRCASAALGNTDQKNSSIHHAIEESRTAMVAVMGKLEDTAQLSMQAIRSMEQVEISVGKVTKVLAQLDQSACANKILALNAKIEAVHVGEAGKGFEVVAQEISSQAVHSIALTVEVRTILEELVATTRSSAAELRKQSIADQECLGSSRKEIQATLAHLEEANRSMLRSLQVAAEDGAELGKEIDQALVTLQFQDRVSQRIQHVAESLLALNEAAGQEHQPGVSVATQNVELLDNLAKSYTMACERTAHTGANEPAEATESGDDVELF